MIAAVVSIAHDRGVRDARRRACELSARATDVDTALELRCPNAAGGRDELDSHPI